MFSKRFFGPRYFGARFFGEGGDQVAPPAQVDEAAGGAWFWWNQQVQRAVYEYYSIRPGRAPGAVIDIDTEILPGAATGVVVIGAKAPGADIEIGSEIVPGAATGEIDLSIEGVLRLAAENRRMWAELDDIKKRTMARRHRQQQDAAVAVATVMLFDKARKRRVA